MSRTTASNRFSTRNIPYSIKHTGTNDDEFTTTNTFDPNGQSWSLFFWAKEEERGIMTFVSQASGGGGTGRSWLRRLANNTLNVSIGGTSRSFSTVVNDSYWHHYGLVYDNSANTYTLYFDGSADATVLTALTPETNTSVIRFGVSNVGAGPLTGYMTNILMFSDVVTADEAAAIYYQGYYDRTNLTLEYLMTDGTGTTITDTSGTGDDGIIIDLTWSDITPLQQRTSQQHTALSAFRLPIILRDYNCTNMWDMRTGYVGDNRGELQDMLGNLHLNFQGSTALSSVYTNSEYSVDLTPANDDYFASRDEKIYNTAPTNYSVLCWVNRDVTGAAHTLFSMHDSVVPTQRSFLFRIGTDDLLEVLTSSDGSTTVTANATDCSINASTWTCCIWTFDGSLGVSSRSQLYTNDTACTMSGSSRTSLFAAATAIRLGAFINSAGNSASEINGKIGITLVANNTTWTSAQVTELYNLTKVLGGY